MREVRASSDRGGGTPASRAASTSRRRPLQPHRVAVGDAEGREQRRERVADERRVEVREVARAKDDKDDESERDDDCPHGRVHDIPIHGPSSVHRNRWSVARWCAFTSIRSVHESSRVQRTTTRSRSLRVDGAL